ncbi:MAG: hypothetical protein OEW12_03495 [Deltaproteobacteria bacterium]|nr:hypothetical protein [Deltaproteobacteria bacterium]
MATWIKFQFEGGDSILLNAEDVYFSFKPSENSVIAYPTGAVPQGETPTPLMVYPCESPEQVTAAEELVFDALEKDQSLAVTLDSLEDYSIYMNHINGLRMVLQLIHNGSIRIPMEGDFPAQELINPDPDSPATELGQFEDMLATYLDVPKDSLRRAVAKETQDTPFEVAMDHEACDDHGFHEYWVVKVRPDRHYTFREKYNELAKSISEKEGFSLEGTP